MTADGWHSIAGSACKQHTATTALVLWNYNIALEPKCMLLEVTGILCQQCFSRFLDGIYHLFGVFLNGVIVKKTNQENMGNVLCV